MNLKTQESTIGHKLNQFKVILLIEITGLGKTQSFINLIKIMEDRNFVPWFVEFS